MEKFVHLFGLALKIAVLGTVFAITFVFLLIMQVNGDLRYPGRASRRSR